MHSTYDSHISLFLISKKSKSYQRAIALFFWHQLLGCSDMHGFSLSKAVNLKCLVKIRNNLTS